MRSGLYVAAVAVLVAAVSSCNLTGPSEPLSGNWRANVGDKFTFAYMSIEQRGDQISGTACASVTGIVTLYKGVPIRGDAPRVQYDDVATQTRFSGRRDSTGDIIGVYNDRAYTNRDVRFTRWPNAVCQE